MGNVALYGRMETVQLYAWHHYHACCRVAECANETLIDRLQACC
jgi:hypothetical protein